MKNKVVLWAISVVIVLFILGGIAACYASRSNSDMEQGPVITFSESPSPAP